MAKVHPQAKVGFDNTPHLTVFYWPDVGPGGKVRIQSRVKLKDGVHVVALDADTHEVYVIRTRRETEEGTVETLELPNGGIDVADETPLAAARRELLEETGVTACDEAEWVQLFGDDGMHPIDGLVLTSQHGFLLLAGRKVQAVEGEETLEVVTRPLAKLIEMDARNEFHDPLTPYCVRRAQDWLAKHRRALLA